jgi:NAD(P)-dependent dehydrogenase (short-subunit alcohol dehydrogenase family)
MLERLQGRTAVITGAASGIGLALAQQLGAQGMKLVLADIEEGALAGAAAGLKELGCEVVAVRTDVSDYGSVCELARRANEAFGHVHVLCNNAGVSFTGPIWELSLDDWRWVQDVNLWGVIHGIKAFVPAMIAHGEAGHIINTASLASFNGMGDHAAYCASKAAVLSISQALFSELRAWNTPLGVTVLCPGIVKTQVHRSWRNRPATDQSWSERESQDPAVRRTAEELRATGELPETVAQAAIEAMRAGRFYAFAGEWRKYVRFGLEPVLNGENPPVLTWGTDLRPKEKARSAGDIWRQLWSKLRS